MPPTTTAKSISNPENSKYHLSKSGFDYFDYSVSTVPGIVIAGGLYAPIAVVMFGVIAWFYSNVPPVGISDSILISFYWLVAAVVAFFIGSLIAWVAGLLSCCVLCVVAYSFGNPVSPRLLITCIGGAAGFWITVFPWLLSSSYPMGADTPFALYVVGPVLATLFGQTGARWFANTRLIGKYKLPEQNRVRFSIIQIMALTAWCAVATLFFKFFFENKLHIHALAYVTIQLLCLTLIHPIDRLLERRSVIKYLD